MRTVTALLFASLAALPASAQERPLRVFISVDMEGIGGIGTDSMTRASGKDYALGRELMTAEVNAVVEAVFAWGPAEVLVNDSHGDMRNLLHTTLDPRVEYIQGNIKPLGMVQGLDSSFDAAIFLGYHARAGTRDGFLAHTGSDVVKGVWIDGVEVGEGGLNAAYAASNGVPVIVASGDRVFAEQFTERYPDVRTVVTKDAVGGESARLVHPEVVRERLREAVRAALDALDGATSPTAPAPVTIRMRFDSTTRPDVAMAVPGMRRIDGYTVEFEAPDMGAGYALVRLLYKYIGW